MPTAWVQALLIVGATALVCLAAAAMSPDGSREWMVWPAAGIGFALGWRRGWGWAFAPVFGASLFGLSQPHPVFAALSCGLMTLAASIPPILTLRRLAEWKPAEYRLETVLRFLAATLAVGSPLGAAVGVAAAAGGGDTSGLHPLARFFAAWLSLSLGSLLTAPAVLAWIDDGNAASDPDPRSGTFFDLPSVLSSLAVAGAHLLLASWGEGELAHSVLFLFFPIVVWSAIRLDERANALTLFLCALPLLATRMAPIGAPDAITARPIEGGVMIFCATLVGLVLQAVASDRRLALQRVARQARQDMTTGLLNDRGLLAEFGDRLASTNRPHLGLIGLHLNNFDSVSDLCGPIQAMQLEQATADLLLRQAGLQCAARLSAGRYALLIEAQTVSQVRTVAREVYSQLAGQRFSTEHGHLRLQASVGGLLIDSHALINSEDCLSALSDALAIAASVRDPQLFVEPLSQMMIDSRRTLQTKIEHIREAVREGRLELYAQPVVDPEAAPGSLSYEVLTRLRDRDGGLIQPPEFLTLAVQAQMTVALDRAVVKRAFEWLATTPNALERTHKCSINLSGATLSDGAIAEYIRQLRSLYGLPANKIVFEITESEAIRNPSAASRLVDELKAEGFGIALDDFGTGLATFEYLKRFPLDYLKIDGSFIRNLGNSPIDEEIVMSTVRVARRLNLRTIAEHVHSQGVFERLQEMGVIYLQGDLFGSAQPIDRLFERFVEPEGEALAGISPPCVPGSP